MAPPIELKIESMARTTAMYWWVVAAMAPTCWVITRVPPPKAMKSWHCFLLVSTVVLGVGRGGCFTYHDDVADVDVGLTEDDHERDTQQCEGHTEAEGLPFEISSISQDEAGDETPKAGSHAVDVEDVAALDDGQARHDLEERREEAVPDVEFDEKDRCDETATEDGAVLEQMERNERDRSKFPFPDDKADDDREANDEHRNHESRRPLLIQSSSLVREQVERQQEESKSRNQQQQTEGIALNEVELDRLQDRAARISDWDETHVERFTLVVPQQNNQRQVEQRVEDGEDAESPAPTGTGQHGVCEEA